MAITVPTKDELIEQLQAVLSSLEPDIVVSKDSDAGVRIQMLVEALYGLHVQDLNNFNDIFVSNQTSTEALERHADARLTGGRKASTISSNTLGLTITGTNGSTAEVGDQLSSEDGLLYRLTTGITIASGTATASVESIDKGTAANRDSGETLTFLNPPSGINAEATLALAMTGGNDEESDADLVKRILDAYQNPPAGGRFSDYRQQAQAVTGVKNAYTYGPSSDFPTGRQGVGVVNVAITKDGTGSARIPSGVTEQEAVEDAIELQRPAATKDFEVLLPVNSTQSIDVKVDALSGFEFDWTRPVIVTVSSYTAATRTLVLGDEVADFAGSGRNTLRVGDRIIVGTGGGTGAEVNTVKSITDNVPAGQSTIVVDDDFDTAPQSGDTFNPAGPLTQPMIDAIKAYVDELGPSRINGPDPNQNWDDTLRVAKIEDVCFIEGVKDVDVVTPATNQQATDSTPATIAPSLITYGKVLVRPNE